MKFRLLSLFGLVTAVAIAAGVFLQDLNPDKQKSLVDISDLSDWKGLKKGDKDLWEVNELDHLQTATRGTGIFQELVLPDVVEIELRASSEQELGIVIGLGIPRAADDFRCVPKLGGFETASHFGFHMESKGNAYPRTEKPFEARIVWDRPNNSISVFEVKPNGRKLFEEQFEPVDKLKVSSGISILNRYGELTIEKFIVRQHLAPPPKKEKTVVRQTIQLSPGQTIPIPTQLPK